MESSFAAPSAKESGSDKAKAKEGGAEQEPQGDSADGGNQNFLKRMATKRNAKKAGIAGVAGGSIFGLVFGVATITSGPFRVIHWGQQVLKPHSAPVEDFSESRSSKFLLYALAGKTAKGRLGFIRQHNANKWERRLNESGLKSVYSTSGSQRLIGYEITDETKAKSFVDDMKSDNIKITDTINGQDINGNRLNAKGKFVDLHDGKASLKRSATRTATKALGVNRLSAALGARLLGKRGGVNFHPWKNIVRKQTDKLLDWRQKIQDERIKGATNGVGSISPGGEERRSKFLEIKGKLQGFVNAAKGPLIAIMAVCGLKQYSASIDAQVLDNQLQMMRLGMESVTGGNEVMANGINAEQVGVYADALYDPKTKTSVTDDAGVRYESGNESTGFDYVAGVKPGSVDKPWFFDVVDNIPMSMAPQYPGLEYPISPDICTYVSAVGEAVGNFPVVKQVTEAIQWTLDNVFIKPLSGGRTLAELIQESIVYFAGGAVDPLARGAKKGGQDNIGVLLAMDNQMFAMGGTFMSEADAQEVKHDARIGQKQTFARASLYDRYLNLYESQSAMASFAASLPASRVQFFASVKKLPITMADMLTRAFGLSKAFAYDAKYDYGFPLVGYTLAEQNDPTYENPYANEDYMLEGDRLERMNAEYGDACFYSTITREGNLVNSEPGDIRNVPTKCSDKSNIELTHYRFYHADIVAGTGIACQDGDADACEQLGFGEGSAAAPASGTPGDSGTIDLNTVFQASDTMTCSAGTDGGVQDGYHDGSLVKIRVCVVQGARVNARIASNVDALLKAGASTGITAGDSFRTMDDQIQRRKDNHCPDIYKSPSKACDPDTAIPGFSNHQMGLAIDYKQNNSSIKAGSSGFTWMQANAAKYGMKNYAPEPWHWSVNGN